LGGASAGAPRGAAAAQQQQQQQTHPIGGATLHQQTSGLNSGLAAAPGTTPAGRAGMTVPASASAACQQQQQQQQPAFPLPTQWTLLQPQLRPQMPPVATAGQQQQRQQQQPAFPLTAQPTLQQPQLRPQMPPAATAGQQRPAVPGVFAAALSNAAASGAGAALASRGAIGSGAALPQQHQSVGSFAVHPAMMQMLRQQVLAQAAAAAAGQQVPTASTKAVPSSGAGVVSSAAGATAASAHPVGGAGQQPGQPTVPSLVPQALQPQQQWLAGALGAQQPLQQQALVGGLAAVPLSGISAAGMTVPPSTVAGAAGLQHQQQPAGNVTAPWLHTQMQQ
jgi:hypothetical protein